MKFTLTAFDIFDEGWIKTVFEVEASSQETGERIIKKQLSKLFRDFPAGQLVSAWMMESHPVLSPSLTPNWVPNIPWNTSGGLPTWIVPIDNPASGPQLGDVTWSVQSNEFTGVAGHVMGATSGLSGSAWMNVQPGETVLMSGVNNHCVSVTNSTGNVVSISNTGINPTP